MAKTLTNMTLGPYVLRELLGSGGVSEVYRADHRDDSRLGFAVKVMRVERLTEKQQLDAFREEFEALQELRHPSIPIARRMGEIDGRPAFVMDLVPGRNLGELFTRQEQYPSINCLVQLSATVAHLHHSGVIHNDVKLENCILRPDGQLSLVDFGSIRRPQRTSLLRKWFGGGPKQIFGTPTYLAPELLAGRNPTFSTDVYALGVCAFMLLTGKPPFAASSMSGRLRAAVTSVPPSITSRLPGIHPGVATVLDRCLSKNPQERPTTAEEVHAAAKLHLDKQRDSSLQRALRSDDKPKTVDPDVSKAMRKIVPPPA